MSKTRLWNKVAESVAAIGGLSNPVAIDNENFVVSTTSGRFYFDIVGLHTFNTTNRKKTKFINYSPNIDTLNYHRICYDSENKRIFMYGYQKRLFIYNYDNGIFDRYDMNIQIGSYPNMICIDGDFHLIGGASNKCHKIWDTEQHKFKDIFKFKEFQSGNYGAGLIYLQSKQELIFFGGYDYSTYTYFDTIWCHKIGDIKWNILNVKLPHKMMNFGYILTFDERFLIIFGGTIKEGDMEEDLNEIWFLDLQNTLTVPKWEKSVVKCPTAGTLYAVLMGSAEDNELLVNGYIREQMKDMELLIPMEIIDLMCLWYSNEIVHLVTRWGNDHWKINVNNIF